MVRRSPALCAMTSQAGNITGNSHVKVRLKASQLFHLSKGRKTMPRLSKYLNSTLVMGVGDGHILRAKDGYIHRWKLVFIVYTRPSSNSKGSDMPNRL